MLARLGAGDHMLRMQSAGRQHRNGIDILPAEKIVDVVMRGNVEFRGDRVGTRGNRIADGDETGAVDMMAAQQLGMTLGDATATKQAKSEHDNPSLAETEQPCGQKSDNVRNGLNALGPTP